MKAINYSLINNNGGASPHNKRGKDEKTIHKIN